MDSDEAILSAVGTPAQLNSDTPDQLSSDSQPAASQRPLPGKLDDPSFDAHSVTLHNHVIQPHSATDNHVISDMV